jgi:phage gpG-like protein
MTVSIKFEPTVDELKKRQEGRKKKLESLDTVMAKVAVYLDQWVQRNFQSEGGNVGGWLPFAAGGRWKNGKFDPSAKLLQDTGRLKHSFLPFSSKKNAGVMSDLDYSIFHEEGTAYLPSRRMLPEAKEVKQPIKDMFGVHVKESLK